MRSVTRQSQGVNDGMRRRGLTAAALRVGLGYLAMLAAAVAALLCIRALGANFVVARRAAPEVVHVVRQAAVAAPFGRLLLSLVGVLFLSHLLGGLFRRLRQPAVLAEISAGIVLGPSILGHFSPRLAAWLVPESVVPAMGVVAELGIVVYMFVIGLELDLGALGKRAGATLTVAHASIVVPLVFGSAFALYSYPRFGTGGVGFSAYALFLGVAMSVTAFPVLSRILGDLGLQRTRLGVSALACAAIADVTAWCLLAFVVALVQADAAAGLHTLLWAIAFVVASLLVVRPMVKHWASRSERSPRRAELGWLLCLALMFAFVTDRIGLHAIFGAFLLGALIPHESALAQRASQRLGDAARVLLLPAFFALTGLHTEIGLLSSVNDQLICAVIIALGSLGKFGGTALASRLIGHDWRDAMSLGLLMNTRGLMELVVLNVGLELGIVSPRLFSMFVIMALVTTFATTPLLQWLMRRASLARSNVTVNDSVVGGT